MGKGHLHDNGWMEEAPFLASLRGALPPDEAPEGYFDALPATIMDRIRSESPQDEAGSAPGDVVLPAPNRRRPGRVFWMAAASAVLLASLGIAFLNPFGGPGGEDPMEFDQHIQAQLTSLSDEQILAQLELDNVTEQDLFDVLGQEAQAAFGKELHGLGQESLLDYLEEMDLDAIDLQGMELDADFLQDTEL